MDLCTVTNYRYLKNAILLANSYIRCGFDGKIYLYHFDISESIINLYKKIHTNIVFLNVPKECDYAYESKIFFYKSYALNDCIANHSEFFLYSDATNTFATHIDNIEQYFYKNILILPYIDIKLSNKYWTTKLCLHKMNANDTIANSFQYWAGLQGYKSCDQTKKLLSLLHEKMLDPDIAKPAANIRYPDGPNNDCIEHRQDQSVLSILIEQLNLSCKYDHRKQSLFGDLQTFKLFNSLYHDDPSIERCIISRDTKYSTY